MIYTETLWLTRDFSGFYGGLMGSNGILPSGKLTVCYGKSTNVS